MVVVVVVVVLAVVVVVVAAAAATAAAAVVVVVFVVVVVVGACWLIVVVDVDVVVDVHGDVNVGVDFAYDDVDVVVYFCMVKMRLRPLNPRMDIIVVGVGVFVIALVVDVVLPV